MTKRYLYEWKIDYVKIINMHQIIIDNYKRKEHGVL